ncbi:protein kinase domain-containing protein [Antrihabitans spumae]|uniref:non-specific serine/threonine protein kinase n=1 Tax=Antrihabitans spumae TaxID=3373370 RepID=A0ABW7KLE3_9NOCA
MTLAPGSVFAGYRIIRLLGVGGMGSVYLAAHPRLPRNDAVKLLSGGNARNPEFRARFEREADIAAAMRHPNIVSVYDRGAEGDQLWISMQYIEGRDAAELIEAGPNVLTVQRTVDIIDDAAKALDYAHSHGLLHRDVKPANILVTPPIDRYSRESALLTDFGIARAIASANEGLTMPGDVLATIAYAAPEQLEGSHVDHRVDIYALGCTLYQMLTGSYPYPRNSMAATMHAHLTAPPPQPSQVRPGLPPAIDRVIAKALAKAPENRYNSCHELAEDAARALAVNPAPAGKSGLNRGLLIGLGAAAAAAVVAVGVVVAVQVGSNDSGSGGTTTTSQAAAGPTAEASDGSFVVSLPDGWSAEDPEDLLKLLTSDGQANILVSKNPSSSRGKTVDESADINATSIQDDVKGVLDSGGVEATTVGGEPARRFTYSLFAKDGQVPKDVRGRQLYVRHKSTEYIVTYTGLPEAFNLGVAEYEAIMDSWEWTD